MDGSRQRPLDEARAASRQPVANGPWRVITPDGQSRALGDAPPPAATKAEPPRKRHAAMPVAAPALDAELGRLPVRRAAKLTLDRSAVSIGLDAVTLPATAIRPPASPAAAAEPAMPAARYAEPPLATEDAGLARLTRIWPHLSHRVRDAVLAMVEVGAPAE